MKPLKRKRAILIIAAAVIFASIAILAVVMDRTEDEQTPTGPKKMTLEEVRALAVEHPFSDVLADIEAVHGEPDVIGGSGVTFKEYWLNDEGSKKIVAIMEQANLFYMDGSKTEILK